MDTKETIEQGSSLWSDAWQRLRKNKLATLSLIFFILILALCFLVPLIGLIGAPAEEAEQMLNHWFKPPNYQDLQNTFSSANSSHWLGTDHSGRDLFARLLYGGQISLLVGMVSTLISLFIGVTYGAIAGYKGGKIDALMMRVVDVLYGLPFLVLVILFSLLISSYVDELSKYVVTEWKWDGDTVGRYANLIPLFIAISALGWLTMARIARAQVISLKKQEFVEAAVSLGHTHSHILFKHILPNMLGPVIVYTTLTVPGFILTEATLSFLGLGVEAPNSSWGILLKEGANFMETQPQLIIIPGIVFSLTLLSLNFLGDGLRDALDPKAAKD